MLNIDYSGFSNYYASIQDSTDVISDMASLLRSTIRYVTYGEARYIYYEYDDGSQVVLYDWPSSSTYQQIPLTWGSGGSITSPVSVTINREHVWARNDMKIKPQSGSTSISRYEPHILDNGTFYHSPSNTDSGLYSDLFNLWNSLASPNSTHGDSFFGEESGASAKYYSSGGVFYPGDEYKGDIARMLFYMTLMYPYLTLVDKGDSNAVEGSYFYGYLDVLLEWNAEDPVSDYEIAKAQLNFDEQRNRNPFVDFYDQDFAELLFAYGDPNVAD
ncbi:MAG: endonuclease [Bacilli bacterium]|nr:endonuclease [Bacilli bacterium]